MEDAATEHIDHLDSEYKEHAYEDFCAGWKAATKMPQ